MRNFALRQENDEIRAIYGAGNYSLSIPYSRFKVDSSRWHSWGEDKRREHVEKFRAYQPTPSNFFRKPRNVGRKQGFSERRRNEEANVIVDRIDEFNTSSTEHENSTINAGPSNCDVSQSAAENSQIHLRFSDPRIDPEKQFELHFRKDLPRLIKKCQGMCGKTIKPDSNDMVIKSYGTSTWTDRSSGTERSKFGPMYIHFNQKCLENFDSEKHYGPGSRFDYRRVQVNKETQDTLKESEKKFLTDLGVTFL